jgi:hypothetical protein
MWEIGGENWVKTKDFGALLPIEWAPAALHEDGREPCPIQSERMKRLTL